MIELNDKRWKKFEGGYRTPYDASVPLKKLEQSTTSQEIDLIFKELWEELHHQGDVGLASYFAVPHLIRIAKEKKIINYNIFGLITTIEIERHKNNPPLPEEFESSYLQSLKVELPELIKLSITNDWDSDLTITILSALAVSKGQTKLAEAITKMDDDVLTEFLENF